MGCCRCPNCVSGCHLEGCRLTPTARDPESRLDQAMIPGCGQLSARNVSSSKRAASASDRASATASHQWTTSLSWNLA
jgi:hypothetical protein